MNFRRIRAKSSRSSRLSMFLPTFYLFELNSATVRTTSSSNLKLDTASFDSGKPSPAALQVYWHRRGWTDMAVRRVWQANSHFNRVAGRGSK